MPNILMQSAYTFYILGLHPFWFAFPTTEILTTLVGIVFYRSFMKNHST